MKKLLFVLFWGCSIQAYSFNWKEYKLGIGYGINYFQPYNGLKANNPAIQKYTFFGFDLYGLNGNPIFSIKRDHWLLEYSIQKSYSLDYISFKNYYTLYSTKYGFDAFPQEYIISSIVKRHTLFLSKKLGEEPLTYYVGAGIGLVVTPNLTQIDSVKIVTTNGTFYGRHERNSPTQYVPQIGFKAGFCRSILNSGISMFGEIHYLKGLWKTDQEHYYYKINDDILDIKAFTRSTTLGGTVGLRFELDFTIFNKKK